jgi:Calcineurin-like phosphoesterase
MSKQLIAALAGVVLGAFLAGSAATAQAERPTCPPSEITVSGQKVQARCRTKSPPEVDTYAIPTASSAFGDRADYLLEILLATREAHKPALDFRYFPSATDSFYDHIPGPEFGCSTTDCRPAEAAFLRAPVHAWVGLGPHGAEARIIVPGSGSPCPDLVVDGVTRYRMVPRQSPRECPEGFEVTVCAASIPEHATTAKIGEVVLPLPPRQIQKIAILGDTGCRLKNNNCPPAGAACRSNCVATDFQHCNDPARWPFATVAEMAALSRPDLVIHVGDYSYREARCPPGNPHCAGSPWGDNWPSWRADFFDPAAPLLAAAPWVFVRGNHEDCNRAHRGWFYFLDPGGYPDACNDDPAPYAVQLPDLQLLVLNTSSAGSAPSSHYTSAFQEVRTLADTYYTPSWLLSHHPLWAFLHDSRNGLVRMTTVLQDALGSAPLPASIEFTVAGHIHLFEVLGFAQQPGPWWRPPGGVFGMGGTELDTPVSEQLVNQTIHGATVNAAATTAQFGYALAERDGSENRWKLTAYSPTGKILAACSFEGMSLACQPPGP